MSVYACLPGKPGEDVASDGIRLRRKIRASIREIRGNRVLRGKGNINTFRRWRAVFSSIIEIFRWFTE